MSDHTDDQDNGEALLPSLTKGVTVRLAAASADNLAPIPLQLRPQNDESSRIVAPGARPPTARPPADTPDDDATIISDAASLLAGKPQAAGDPQASDPAASDAPAPLPSPGDAAADQSGPVQARPDPARDSKEIIDSEPAERVRGARRGDVIGGRYLVEGQIGRGGMGRVLQVRHQVLGKPFALKLIKAPIAADRRIREMFYQEAKLASGLSHENICSIVDFGVDTHFGLFMVMELLEGQTLFHRLYYKGNLAPKVACDVIWQVAEALRYIHGQGIVHGDIKSENILLIRTPEQRRVVKLLDFGLARANLAGPVGGIEGTPEYLAPERIRGGAASTASDIYALGVLFYELLVGKLPFTGEMEQVFRMHLAHPIPRPSEQVEGSLEERADEIIARATAKKADERHPDVAGFMYELRTLMGMLGMPLPGRRRAGATDPRSGRARVRSGPNQRIRAAADLFEHAPVPMAALDREGRVQVANQAFMRFVGLQNDTAGIALCEPLSGIYPELPEDLHAVATLRTTVKRVLQLEGQDGDTVEVAIILTAAPEKTSATTGEVRMTLHPLGRQ